MTPAHRNIRALQNGSIAMSTNKPVSEINIAGELEAAACIVAGTVTGVSDANESVSLVSAEARPGQDQLCKAEIAVIRAIAGERPDDLLTVFFLRGTTPGRSWKELAAGQTVLLFLRPVAGGYVPVASSDNPIQTLPGIDDPPPSLGKTHAVAHELEQIVLQADPALNLEMIVNATMARAQVDAIVDLGLLETDRLRNSVRRLAWIAIALGQRQFDALKYLPALIEDKALLHAPALERTLIQGVTMQVSPAARPYLAALIQSSNPDIAVAAAMALRQLHSSEALADLALGLSHADVRVRYQSVMGLSELEPTIEAGPSFDLFQESESYYLNRWKQWWADTSSDVTRKS
jgi:hypothetical protein